MHRPLGTTLRVFASSLLALSLLGADAPKGGDAAKSAEPSAGAGEAVQWLAFDAAVEKAQKENKHMIVDIYTNWCGWCKVMDRQTYGKPEVAAFLSEHFALAKVNGESSAKLTWNGRTLTEREFARAVGVNGYPSTFFMKPNAELLGGVAGYIKSPDMMIYARYISSKLYERGKLQDFADSLRNVGS
jgi:thioredoxin-related protein